MGMHLALAPRRARRLRAGCLPGQQQLFPTASLEVFTAVTMASPPFCRAFQARQSHLRVFSALETADFLCPQNSSLSYPHQLEGNHMVKQKRQGKTIW